MCDFREWGLICQLARNENEKRFYKRRFKIKRRERSDISTRTVGGVVGGVDVQQVGKSDKFRANKRGLANYKTNKG